MLPWGIQASLLFSMREHVPDLLIITEATCMAYVKVHMQNHCCIIRLFCFFCYCCLSSTLYLSP